MFAEIASFGFDSRTFANVAPVRLSALDVVPVEQARLTAYGDLDGSLSNSGGTFDWMSRGIGEA